VWIFTLIHSMQLENANGYRGQPFPGRLSKN
jgi:hypothetical protein